MTTGNSITCHNIDKTKVSSVKAYIFHFNVVGNLLNSDLIRYVFSNSLSFF